METKSVTIKLPVAIHRNLEQIARASGWAFEDVLLRAIRTGLPPSLDKVPHEFHEDLIALNKMSDLELLDVVEGKLKLATALDEKRKKADFEILRRTYALFLLRWRGHPVPKAYEALISS